MPSSVARAHVFTWRSNRGNSRSWRGFPHPSPNIKLLSSFQANCCLYHKAQGTDSVGVSWWRHTCSRTCTYLCAWQPRPSAGTAGGASAPPPDPYTAGPWRHTSSGRYTLIERACTCTHAHIRESACQIEYNLCVFTYMNNIHIRNKKAQCMYILQM